MSLRLLDLGVNEARQVVPPGHFLWQDENIEAAQKMIMGNDADVPPGHKWLYGIVNNTRSGACLASKCARWSPRLCICGPLLHAGMGLRWALRAAAHKCCGSALPHVHA
jgi:hypothetical protein